MNPRKTLKEYLQRNKLLIAPGCFDGLSARLVEQAGFEAAYLSGGAVARSMGIPDIGLVTMSETIERASLYGRRALDALAQFPAGKAKAALSEAVEFAISRAY